MRKSEIMYQLINYENNKELLKNLPHIRYLDLAIVFYGKLYGKKEERYALLSEEGRKAFGLTLEELESLAAENTRRLCPERFCPLEQILQEAGGITKWAKEGDGADVLPMYVLTNREKMFGAACILYPGTLNAIARRLRSDLYLLPSSIHECILVPESSGFEKEELQKLVREVNRAELSREEKLSDFVYFYSRSGDRIGFS